MINIKASHKFTLPLYNGGVNQSNIELNKEQLLMQEFRKCKELVNTNVHYPINNHVSYDMSLDVVILNRKEYEQLTNKEYESVQ
jgi:hypothetical protein